MNALAPAPPSPAAAAAAAAVAAAREKLVEGAIVDHYEIIRVLGAGGMGQVFLARDLKLGRLVALKVMHPTMQEEAARILVEARATAKCRHENIVVIHDLNMFEGLPYLVLEHLEGSSMRRFYTDTPLPVARALEMFCGILRGLENAHAAGIIHRDLKPDNVFVTTAGVPKILDFGIAKLHGAPATDTGTMGRIEAVPNDDNETYVTISGSGRGPVGTWSYMSPEQFRSETDVDHRADLWAVGIMMFKLFTGHLPWGKPDPHVLMYSVADLDNPTPSVLSIKPDLDPQLAAIIDTCLRKSRDERFANARAMLDALEPLLPGNTHGASERCPYPGLSAFEEADAQRFFGRSADIARAVARLESEPLLAVVGPSGTGKSSFIRAGLVPAIRSAQPVFTIAIRPGRAPLAALAQAIVQLTGKRDPGYAQRVAEELPSEPAYLGSVLRWCAHATQSRVLLIVDQLEELYTNVPDPAQRTAFVTALRAAADDPSSPVRVVLSMRSDFLDRAAEDRGFMEAITRGLHYLMPLGRDGLRDALVRPAALAGHTFESPDLVESMIDEIATTAGALPLLQFAAGQMWEARDRPARILTRASYIAMNGIGGTLAQHADRVLADMPPARRALAHAVFRRLVTPDGTRAIVDLAELVAISPLEVPSLIDTLVGSRLLVSSADEQTAGATVEIVHESLINAWPQLKQWMEASRDEAKFLVELRQAAQQWDARGRAPGLLWRGEMVAEARRFGSRMTLGPREYAFLGEVFALADRSSRIKRIAVIATMIGLVALLIAGSVVVVKVRAAEQRAREQAAKAEQATTDLQQQLEVTKQKDAERLAAMQQAADEQKKAAEAEGDATTSRAALAKSNAKLTDSNAQLQKTLAEVQAEREKTQKLYEAEQHRNKQLEEHGKGIAHDLHSGP
ncbi:MAG TPA: protein kinase [Kofleriaceae bacterium]|nr:protein kinase [Kofleriaceae bacterium]